MKKVFLIVFVAIISSHKIIAQSTKKPKYHLYNDR